MIVICFYCYCSLNQHIKFLSNLRVCEKLTLKTAIIVDCSAVSSLVYIWGICFENLRFIYFLLYTYECFAEKALELPCGPVVYK